MNKKRSLREILSSEEVPDAYKIRVGELLELHALSEDIAEIAAAAYKLGFVRGQRCEKNRLKRERS